MIELVSIIVTAKIDDCQNDVVVSNNLHSNVVNNRGFVVHNIVYLLKVFAKESATFTQNTNYYE